MFEGWLMLAGTEILNSERTRVYAGHMGTAPACGCPRLPAALGDEPYIDPVSDGCAWYDPDAPESKDFAGLLGLELTGSDSTATRPWTELLGDGGRPGGLRIGSRELEVKASALAATDEALTYGIAWLASALRGSEDESCNGDELCAMAACPGQPRSNPDDPCEPPAAPSRARDVFDEGTRLLRHLHGVNLMTGPTVEDRTRVAGMSIATVSFTLKAAWPFWYRNPARVLDTSMDHPERVDWLDDYDILAGADCREPADCLADTPFCRDNGPWGDEPFPGWGGHDQFGQFLDPCYPVTPFDALREIYQISDLRSATWLDKAPVMQFYSGSSPLKRLTIRWYPNPQDYPPSRRLDPCTSCAELTVPWIPSRTTLTLDGRVHTATVDCRGAAGGVSSNVTLYGPRGGIYTWPTFSCGVPMLCEVIMHRGSAADDRQLTIDFAAREDAN